MINNYNKIRNNIMQTILTDCILQTYSIIIYNCFFCYNKPVNIGIDNINVDNNKIISVPDVIIPEFDSLSPLSSSTKSSGTENEEDPKTK